MDSTGSYLHYTRPAYRPSERIEAQFATQVISNGDLVGGVH